MMMVNIYILMELVIWYLEVELGPSTASTSMLFYVCAYVLPFLGLYWALVAVFVRNSYFWCSVWMYVVLSLKMWFYSRKEPKVFEGTQVFALGVLSLMLSIQWLYTFAPVNFMPLIKLILLVGVVIAVCKREDLGIFEYLAAHDSLDTVLEKISKNFKAMQEQVKKAGGLVGLHAPKDEKEEKKALVDLEAQKKKADAILYSDKGGLSGKGMTE